MLAILNERKSQSVLRILANEKRIDESRKGQDKNTLVSIAQTRKSHFATPLS